MNKGNLAIVAVAAAMLSACGSAGPEEIPVTYGFLADVDIATAQPTPGRRVDFVVEVRSTGNVPVMCDVIMSVVSDKGVEIYRQKWEDVKFEPASPWNLQNGFLPATDVEKSYKLSVEVRRSTTGELLFSDGEVSRLEFSRL
ncbi:MAG: hypothetical protein JNK82_09535 [Myxococcaceae bacterium]|nr:hypothetical protein [Myxococcaceae bacterium]